MDNAIGGMRRALEPDALMPRLPKKRLTPTSDFLHAEALAKEANI
jgi:hypothetical protein